MTNLQTLKSKREKLDKQIAELEAKELLEKNKVTTKIVKLSCGTFEVEIKIHHFNKTYAECEKDCPKGWEIATYPILQELRNTQPEDFDLINTWEFCQNADVISKKNKYVARFIAYSDGANLSCGRVPSYTYSALGVRFVRRIK